MAERCRTVNLVERAEITVLLCKEKSLPMALSVSIGRDRQGLLYIID